MTYPADIRKNKKQLIEEFFLAHLGQPINSMDLHLQFGSSVRTRISEINRDEESPLRIKNECRVDAAREVSFYTAERKVRVPEQLQFAVSQ